MIVQGYRGSNHQSAKLDEAQVRRIKCELIAGVKIKVIAEAYHVTGKTIRMIKRGFSWKHVVL